MIRRLASAAIMERQEPQATLLRLRLIGSIEAADLSGCDVLPSSRKSRALLSGTSKNRAGRAPANLTR